MYEKLPKHSYNEYRITALNVLADNFYVVVIVQSTKNVPCTFVAS